MRDTTEAYGELQKQRHGGTVSRKVGAICEVCGWAWQPVVVMCHLARLVASGMNADPGRSDSKAEIVVKAKLWVDTLLCIRSLSHHPALRGGFCGSCSAIAALGGVTSM